jgi:hypothetical protein
MAGFRFSYTQRYAIWKAYGGRCFYCEQPIDFRELTIDHIVPESLLNDLPQLANLRTEYGIDDVVPGFQINDVLNWVPAHARRCNAGKSNSSLPKKLLLLCLQEVQKKLPSVKEEMDKLEQSRSRSHAIGSLSSAIENSHLSIDDVRAHLAELEAGQHADEPLVMTFGLNIEDLSAHDEVPHELLENYAALCDWLELSLVRHLRSILSTRFYYIEPSDRWGDGLSVRIVFPDVKDDELDRFNLPWWNILEACSFWDTFGVGYKEAFRTLPEKEYFGELPETE